MVVFPLTYLPNTWQKPPQNLPKDYPNYPPDAIRIGARRRMASGGTFGVQMPFVLQLEDEWHLEGANRSNEDKRDDLSESLARLASIGV